MRFSITLVRNISSLAENVSDKFIKISIIVETVFESVILR